MPELQHDFTITFHFTSALSYYHRIYRHINGFFSPLIVISTSNREWIPTSITVYCMLFEFAVCTICTICSLIFFVSFSSLNPAVPNVNIVNKTTNFSVSSHVLFFQQYLLSHPPGGGIIEIDYENFKRSSLVVSPFNPSLLFAGDTVALLYFATVCLTHQWKNVLLRDGLVLTRPTSARLLLSPPLPLFLQLKSALVYYSHETL